MQLPFLIHKKYVSLFQLHFLLYWINKGDTKAERNKKVFKAHSLMKKKLGLQLPFMPLFFFSFKFIADEMNQTGRTKNYNSIVIHGTGNSNLTPLFKQSASTLFLGHGL